jgi:hypothetical protein
MGQTRAPPRALRLYDGIPSGYARTARRVPRVAGEAPTTLGCMSKRLRRKYPEAVPVSLEPFGLKL